MDDYIKNKKDAKELSNNVKDLDKIQETLHKKLKYNEDGFKQLIFINDESILYLQHITKNLKPIRRDYVE